MTKKTMTSVIGVVAVLGTIAGLAVGLPSLAKTQRLDPAITAGLLQAPLAPALRTSGNPGDLDFPGCDTDGDFDFQVVGPAPVITGGLLQASLAPGLRGSGGDQDGPNDSGCDIDW